MTSIRTKKCWYCEQNLPLSEYNKNGSEKDGHQKFCRQCQREYGRIRYRKNQHEEQKRNKLKYHKLKKEILKHYGDCCSCCGEDIPDFLAIDHIDNDGAEHRKTVPGGIGMYYWLKRNSFPEGFQILCHNCNWSKHVNGGVCIHKLKHEQD